MSTSASGFELVALKAGGYSLRERGNNETFHPVVGPMAEATALHVRQQRLVERARAAAAAHRDFIIWDVGLGAAANAVAVREAFSGSCARVKMISFEQTLAPLEFALGHAAELGYVQPHVDAIQRLVDDGYCPPEPACQIEWVLCKGDFRQIVAGSELPAPPAPDAILYDPYSAKANPEMWNLEHFSRVRGHLEADRPCLLSNYTRSTAIRVTLMLAGFYVGRGVPVGDKGETTVASNTPELLDAPLDSKWLQRVHASTNGAPLRLGQSEGPISESDFQTLSAHRQFA